MTRALERAELEADLAAAENMLADLPEDAVLERIGFEARARRAREQLALMAKSAARNAQVAVYFGGRPVLGTLGVEAEFGGNALAKFQGLVDAMRTPHKTPGDPEDTASLFATGVLHGSFGFQLLEVGDMPLLGETKLAHAVDESLNLLAAAKAEDSLLEDLLDLMGQKVHGALRAFMTHVAEHNASLRVVGELRRVEFDERAAATAAERVSAQEVTEETVTQDCVFGGELDFSRSFELRTVPDEQIIRGRVVPEVPPGILDQWHHQRCRAVLRVVTRERAGVRKKTYHLVRIEAPTSPSGGGT